ncbi:hypothetical protein AAW51_1260 [Caldimonas brevitalea]|uniref:DUF748 domain-containing protein n=1 Tax=Caldimonas brevitalea TaxID=413882 RepID=A0A0G3BKR5_9BURK|nr:hypothetical protein AAW51_1260 [Caldimonas brevitalea]
MLVLTVAAAVGFRLAVQELKAQVQTALGPRSEVGSLNVTWAGVEALDVRVRAQRDGRTPWPAQDELRADRVLVVPELRALLSAEVRVRRVVVDGGYVSMLRTRDGRLRVLPALTERPTAGKPTRASAMRKVSTRATLPAPPASTPAALDERLPVHLGEILLRGAVVEFFDASVRRPALKLRLEALDAQVGPLDLPRLDTPTRIDLQGQLKGAHRDGRVSVRGDITIATRDAHLAADFAGVDLVPLQPYLIKVADAGVRRGTLDLKLEATVRQQQLRAPGHLTLTGLELDSGSGLLALLAGVPRDAVLAALRKNDRLAVDFTLQGRLDDPDFSLNEDLATQVAAGLAEALGLSVGGMVEGMGSVLKGLFGQ